MPIFDYDGSANREIGKVYDYDGTANHQIGKVYDYNGSANQLIYTSLEAVDAEAKVTFTRGVDDVYGAEASHSVTVPADCKVYVRAYWTQAVYTNDNVVLSVGSNNVYSIAETIGYSTNRDSGWKGPYTVTAGTVLKLRAKGFGSSASGYYGTTNTVTFGWRWSD